MSNNEMSDQDTVQSNGPDEHRKPFRRPCRDWRHGDHDDAWWEDRSLPAKIFMGIGFGILGAGFIVLLVFVVMWLWNWLMPAIFDLGRINFWKAGGIMALCFILFKSWGRGGSNRRSDRKRKKHLRSYIQQDQPPAGEDSADPQQA
jgi:hypothetical protein